MPLIFQRMIMPSCFKPLMISCLFYAYCPILSRANVHPRHDMVYKTTKGLTQTIFTLIIHVILLTEFKIQFYINKSLTKRNGSLT